MTDRYVAIEQGPSHHYRQFPVLTPDGGVFLCSSEADAQRVVIILNELLDQIAQLRRVLDQYAQLRRSYDPGTP